jgi:beta-galactosidase/beta-glucuronidase
MKRIIGRRVEALVLCAVALGVAGLPAIGTAAKSARLPEGVTAVWDIAAAHRESTPTRGRICINGLWRWQPAKDLVDAVPEGKWGYFKVPGCWPGITDYMQKDCQTVHAHPSWRDDRLRDVTTAWYQREITIPAEWAGRRITAYVEYLNSYAVAYVDGKRAGELRFPAGEVDLTSICRPGRAHVLSLAVVAMPLKAVMLSYSDSASARQVKGAVARRGLCGDVYLLATPAGARLSDVKVDTSVREGQITCSAAPAGLEAGASYVLRARIADNGRNVKEISSKPFRSGDLRSGRMAFAGRWRPEKLWDIHTAGNTYNLHLSLLDAGGKVLDEALPLRFGFREFWIDGRDFYLNGSRIFLSAVPLDNAQIGAALACYEAARESLNRLKSFGINFVYAHNYGCQPGSHLSFEEVLRAADDVGMLVALSQPHFGHYDWKMPDADRANGYARHAAFYVRVAQNHPSVIAYATSHNGTASGEDMNPDFFGAADIPRDGWSLNNSRLALRAEAIIKGLDPSRIVYHHAGDIGSMHASNFYPNFVPVQEMSDWFEPWAAHGVKPAFLCEYAAPFSWDWAMYRGWYRGKREFGSARVPWEFCLAEWNSQFLGDRAFWISEREKANLRWEARQFRAGSLWHRWDYPCRLGSELFDERQGVLAMYISDNWRAFRTWGLSANSPWECHIFWKLRGGVDKGRKELPVDWNHLQRPGFSPDYVEDRYERMDLAFEPSDWIATPSAQALQRNNGPLLAYLAGKPARFTSKDHNFLPGEAVGKQIVVINNSRLTVTCDCAWSLALPEPLSGAKKVTVRTGQQARVPLSVALPRDLPAGSYKLSLTARFSPGEVQKDDLAINVLEPMPQPKPAGRIALFDPKGQTGKLLRAMGVACDSIDASADLSPYGLLVVGKEALTPEGPAPDVARVREGLKVLLFEQSSDVLAERLGFRVQEYGLRQVFPRVPDHPALAGLAAEDLRDWRGEATIIPPRLSYRRRPGYGPAVSWCGLPVTRVWRCGNRGNVASVLIEKPACGDFLPIVDGGFSLQYSPLLAYREGKGILVFCQMDVTGRTESDPAAERLVRNLLAWLGAWQPEARREAVFVGDRAGQVHLEKSGLRLGPFAGEALRPEQVLIVAPGGGAMLAAHKAAIARWLGQGGRVLAVGLDGAEAQAFLPLTVTTKQAEHIAAYFEPPGARSLLAGVGPADVHNRHPSQLHLVSGRATAVGNGVLAVAEKHHVVFCQLAAWQFDHEKLYHTRRTFRRSSYLLSRLLGNMGVGGETPLLARVSSPTGAGGPPPNVIRNGDFRVDADKNGLADGWELSADSKQPAASREIVAPDPDRWSQRITYPGPAKGKAGSVMLAQHDVPVEKGQWYRISLRAKSEGMKGTRVNLTLMNTADWRSFFEYQEIAPDESWKEFSFTVESNGSAKSGTRFQIWHGSPGTLWLSDVVMSPCDPPWKGRWLTGLYLDRPVEWDDPYRFFRW